MRIFGALDAFAGSSGDRGSETEGPAAAPPPTFPGKRLRRSPGSRRPRAPPGRGGATATPAPSARGRRPCAAARSRGSPHVRAPPSVRLSACVSSSYKDTAHTGSRVAPPRYDFLLTNICSDPAAE